MSTIIAQVEIRIEPSQSQPVYCRGVAEGAPGRYRVSLTCPGLEQVELHVAEESAALELLCGGLRRHLDAYDPAASTINVVQDTRSLMARVVYRCPVPTCRTKLFESWGTANGITIVCRKCKTLSVPVAG